MHKPIKKYLYLVSLLCSLFFSCKKEKHTTAGPDPVDTTAVTSATYSISYTGSQYIGQPIHFTSTAPAGSTFAWSFGDSATSLAPTPYHTYAASGSYLVKLIVGPDTISKVINIGTDSTYNTMLAGSRTYHHIQHFDQSGLSGDVLTVYTDTAIVASFIDPVNMAFGTDTLFYAFTNDSILCFSRTFYFPGTTYGTGSYNTLRYNYLINKVTYSKFNHLSAGANSNDIFDSFP